MKYPVIHFIISISLFFFNSCSDEEIMGCTDPEAINFNLDATIDDGNCSYERDQFIGSYKISTFNCTPTDFLTGLTASINEVPGDVNTVTLSISGIYQKSIIFSGTVSNGGIDLDGEYIVPGTTMEDVFTFNGESYFLPRFIIDGRLEGDNSLLSGRVTLSAEASSENDALIFSFTCDYVMD